MFYNFKQVEDDIIVQYLVLLHAKQMCLLYIITSRNGTTMRFFRPTLPFVQPNLVPRTNIEYTIITRASTTFKWMNGFCLKIKGNGRIVVRVRCP